MKILATAPCKKLDYGAQQLVSNPHLELTTSPGIWGFRSLLEAPTVAPYTFILAGAPLGQAMSPILLASLSRRQWICMQCRRTILKSTTLATCLSLRRAYHPCTVLLHTPLPISEHRLQAQQRQSSPASEKPPKRTVLPLPLPTAEERRRNLAQQSVLEWPTSPPTTRGGRKTQTREKADPETHPEAQGKAQRDLRKAHPGRATAAEGRQQNTVEQVLEQAFSFPIVAQSESQGDSREQPFERATTVGVQQQNIAIQALKQAFPLSIVEAQAQQETQQDFKEQPSQGAITAEERQQDVAQQTLHQAVSSPITEARQQVRLNRQKQPHRLSSLDPLAITDDPASLVSKLLNKATSKALYPHERLDTLSAPTVPKKWATNLVIRPIVREAIKKAYPHVEDLTPIQAKLFVMLSKRTHLALSDIPGTGKSFALACWLLNVDRSIRTGKGDIEPTTTALVLVPSPDLAMQYEGWITNILSNSGSEVIEKNLPSFVQALYRTGTVEGDEQQKCRLKEHPNPHIIVATPQRVLDIIGENLVNPHHLLDLEHLKLVAVDEADSLLDMGIVFHQENKATSQRRIHISPAEQLLDLVFNNRNAKLEGPRQAKGELNYMQIVLTSSSNSAKQMRRYIERMKQGWLSPFGTAWSGGYLSQGRTMGFSPQFTPVKEGDLVSSIIAILQREETTPGEVLRKVHSSIKHHLMAYDMETGILRDAPLNRALINKTLKKFLEVSTKLDLVGGRMPQVMKPLGAQIGKEELGVPGLELQERKVIGDHGYPEELAVPILEKLLEYDNWPRHVIVGLGLQASKTRFQQSCAEVGIKAEVLSYEAWNSQGGKVSKLGRSDEYIADAGGNSENALVEGKQYTSVWITDPASCPGLDYPGITHAYIFHRVESTKDYVAYCGRVSRHPFAETGVEAANPLEAPSVASLSSDESTPGKIKSLHPTPGKVVSIILEEHITPEEIKSERETEKTWRLLEAAAAAGEEGASGGPSSHHNSGYRSGKGEKVVRVISGADNTRGGVEIGLPVLQRGSMWEQDAYLAESIKREKIGCVVEKYFGEDQRFQKRRVLDWNKLDSDEETVEVVAELEDTETRRTEGERTVERKTKKRTRRGEGAVGKRTMGKNTERESTEREREVIERKSVEKDRIETKSTERESAHKKKTETIATDKSEGKVLGWEVGGPIGMTPESEAVKPEEEAFVPTVGKYEGKILEPEADRPNEARSEVKEKHLYLSEKQPIGNTPASPSLDVVQNMETPNALNEDTAQTHPKVTLKTPEAPPAPAPALAPAPPALTMLPPTITHP